MAGIRDIESGKVYIGKEQPAKLDQSDETLNLQLICIGEVPEVTLTANEIPSTGSATSQNVSLEEVYSNSILPLEVSIKRDAPARFCPWLLTV